MSSERKRLAIIGCGSSGLITLKIALEILPDWEIEAFEKSNLIQGCWGNPYPGFVSTSTRYTTQFACYPICDAQVHSDGGKSRSEFFREGEYGEYLEAFADTFELRKHVRLATTVTAITKDVSGWKVVTRNGLDENPRTQRFDAVVVCTGLAAVPKKVDSTVPQVGAQELNRAGGLEAIQQKTIVVIGGGESAVDYADRLAKVSLKNEVYLSLHSGVRVSPRYHPVRGVPSDFLRNRLMLSADPDVRNLLGEVFVRSRIKYQRWFEYWFPRKNRSADASNVDEEQRKKYWTLQLTLAAKDGVFNMFHNKSDDFLRAVGEQRIKIVGPPVDSTYTQFEPFVAGQPQTSIVPDLLVPAVGYESTLERITNPAASLKEFYMGCCHRDHDDLFLVGFARPIIGNIPTISEMQARYVVALIAGKVARPADIQSCLEQERGSLERRYKKLNLDRVFPVEMFPYCDRLAILSGMPLRPPSGSSVFQGVSHRISMMLSPATTMHYFPDDRQTRKAMENAPVYMPPLLIGLILLIKPFDWLYRLFKSLSNRK